jgi:hypothetical protein
VKTLILLLSLCTVPPTAKIDSCCKYGDSVIIVYVNSKPDVIRITQILSSNNLKVVCYTRTQPFDRSISQYTVRAKFVERYYTYEQYRKVMFQLIKLKEVKYIR